MPKKGYTSITVSEQIYGKMQKFIEKHNSNLGFRRFRSVSHLAEEAIGEYLRAKLNPEQ